MDPALRLLVETGDPADEVAVLVRLARPGAGPPAGTRLVSRFGEVATIRTRRALLPAVRADEGVISVKAAALYGAELEEGDGTGADAGPATAADRSRRPDGAGASGSGVVLGVVDFGLDIAHPAFRRPDGSTRLLALWDQQPGPDPAAPNRFGYGRIHTREAIDAALRTADPLAALGYDAAAADPGGGCHGTATTSVAAGSPWPGGVPGAAPDAELVFVHLSTAGPAGPADLCDSVALVEALNFVQETAAGRPCVVNLSLGRCCGPHDGRTLVEQALDAACSGPSPILVVQSCGNYRQRRAHTEGVVRPGSRAEMPVLLPGGAAGPHEIELWYSGVDRMVVGVRGPGGTPRLLARPGEDRSLRLPDGGILRVQHRVDDPNDGRNQVLVRVPPPEQDVTWRLEAAALDVVDGRFHAWIERLTDGTQASFPTPVAVPRTDTGTICNGLRTIVVGGADPTRPGRPVAGFSSGGPTVDGRPKPDLLGWAVDVLVARSRPSGTPSGESWPLSTRMSGTSIAAPHVTGAIACLLERMPGPPAGHPGRIRTALLTTCSPYRGPDPDRAGAGHLDLTAALRAVPSDRTSQAHRTQEAAVSPHVHDMFDEALPPGAIVRDHRTGAVTNATSAPGGTFVQTGPPPAAPPPAGPPPPPAAPPPGFDPGPAFPTGTGYDPYAYPPGYGPPPYGYGQPPPYGYPPPPGYGPPGYGPPGYGEPAGYGYGPPPTPEQPPYFEQPAYPEQPYPYPYPPYAYAPPPPYEAPIPVAGPVELPAAETYPDDGIELRTDEGPGPDALAAEIGTSAAELFDAYVLEQRPDVVERLASRLTPVAAPGRPLVDAAAGDLLVRGQPGEGQASLAQLLNGELLDLDEARARGWLAEGDLPGRYALVREDAPLPWTADERWARRIADAAGFLPADQALLRPLPAGVPTDLTAGIPFEEPLGFAEGGPGAPTPTVADWIALVRRVEAAHPDWSALRTAQGLMRTKFHSRAFDWLLPSTAKVAGVEAGGGVTDSDVTFLRGSTDVTLPDGRQMASSHVTTGIVATAERQSAGAGGAGGSSAKHLVRPLPIEVSQIDVATWVGDIGSAAASWAAAHPLPHGGSTKADYLAEYAPESDLLGDADGVAIAGGGFAFDWAKPLSDNLSRYYGTPGVGAGRRWHAFCAALRLTLKVDGVTLSDAAVLDLDARVERFTDWYGKNDPTLLTWMSIASADHSLWNPFPRMWVQRAGDWRWFAERFRDLVQLGLRAEGPAKPTPAKATAPKATETLEVRPPGPRERSAFDRRQELIDRLNAVSTGIRYRLEDRTIRYDLLDEAALTHFDREMRRFADAAEVIPMRLINRTGLIAGKPLAFDSFIEAYVDLDDLLASSDLGMQMILLHFLTERAQVRDYARLIGVPDLGKFFKKAHRAGLEAQAALLRAVLGDPTIEYRFDEPQPNDTYLYGFHSDEDYWVFQRNRNAGAFGTRGATVFVKLKSGTVLTVPEMQIRRAAAAPAAAKPASAPATAPATAPQPVP